MKKTFLIFSILLNYTLVAQTTVAEYTDFLNQKHQSPKDYILELFEHNDIVILGERDHRDTTQYDLILDIIGDERFIKNVGHIYTEVGVVNRTEWANEVLKKEYKTEREFETALIELYRELDFNPIWEKYNMYKYLKGIYQINKNLPNEKKITIGLTDKAFSWEGMTKEKLTNFHKDLRSSPNKRDSIMAFNFIELYKNQHLINGKRKALYIQSRPHAIDLDVTYKQRKVKRTGSYIKDYYEEKVKIVAFNWYKWIPEEWKSISYGPPHIIELTCNGKWDAAFYLSHNKSIAFDLENTPFGLTEFDYSYEQDIKYQDVLDGIIFYKPFYEFTCTVGIPNIIDGTFVKEMIRREIIVNGEDVWNTEKEIIDYYNEVRTRECADFNKLKKQMNKWLK
jgi:hypothetical protein